MRILVIGNIFESKSFLVNDFCAKDSEVIANDVTSRISGAAIVVSAIAASLDMKPFLYSKVKEDSSKEILTKLSKAGVDTSMIVTNNEKSNILLTIYNSELERQCYSYTPNSILAEDLLKIDFSEFNATFFCCIPFEQVASVFESNASIKNTKSVILASGLTSSYFKRNKFQIRADFIFMNRGELFKLFKKEWVGNQNEFREYMSKVDVNDSVLVVTMGKDGVYIKEKNKEITVEVANIEHIVHPGGAGDAFSVGFIKSVLHKDNYKEGCKIGHECAKKLLSVRSTMELLEKMI